MAWFGRLWFGSAQRVKVEVRRGLVLALRGTVIGGGRDEKTCLGTVGWLIVFGVFGELKGR